MYRPDGWEKVKEELAIKLNKENGGNNYENGGYDFGLEDGADAILEGLKKKKDTEGIVVPCGNNGA